MAVRPSLRRTQPRAERRGRQSPVGVAYDAFISYSHAVDGRLAPALQSALQRFSKPWYRLRALRVFRDDASLSANPRLWSSIERALERSGWFLLLASPESARSPWVGREVVFWLSRRGTERLLIVVTDGELRWDDAAGAFLQDTATPVPPALLTAFEEEPRFIDLRWARTLDHLALSEPRFRNAVADLAAPIHGRAKDDLVGEEVRQHRRSVRLARAAVTTLVVLAVAAAAAAVLAVGQRNEARDQARVATSRALATASSINASDDLQLAGLLALRAFDVEPTFEARNAIVTVGARSEALGAAFELEGSVASTAFNPRRAELAVATRTGLVKRWSIDDRSRPAETFELDGVFVDHLAYSHDGGMLAVSGAVDGGDRRGFVEVRAVDSGPAAPIRLEAAGAVTYVAFAGRRRLVYGDDIGRLFVVRLPTEAGAGPETVRMPGESEAGISSVVVGANGSSVTAVDNEGGIARWRLDRPDRVQIVAPYRDFETTTDVALAPDGSFAAVADAFGNVDVRRSARASRTRQLVRGARTEVVALAVDPPGSSVALGSADGSLRVVDVATGRTKLAPPILLQGGARGISFGDDGRLVAAGGSDGSVFVWDTAGGSTIEEVVGSPVAVPGQQLVFDADGRYVATTAFGRGSLWDTHDSGAGRRKAELSVPGQALQLSAEGRDVTALTEGGWLVRTAIGGRGTRLRKLGGRVAAATLAAADRLAFVEGSGVVKTFDGRQVVRVGSVANPGDSTLASNRDLSLVVVGSVPAGLAAYARGEGPNYRRVVADATSTTSLAVAPTQDRFAAAAYESLYVYAAEQGYEPRLLVNRGHVVRSLAFSPDGSLLAAGDENGDITLWDVQRARRLGEPFNVGRAQWVTALAFTPDSLSLVSVGGGKLSVWRGALDPIVWRERLCTILRRDLTSNERESYDLGDARRSTCRRTSD